jgi:ornithine cyclodeaminase
MAVTILTESEIRKCVGLDLEAITAVEAAFSSLANGDAIVPPILMLEIPENRGETDVKTAHIRGLDSFGIKIASGFFDNYRLGLPSVSSLLVVLSATTGFPQAVLLDNGYLTNVRTGAAGAVAARYLAREKIHTVGVIGAGAQARFQMIALRQVRDFQKLMIYSIIPEEVERYIEEMSPVLGVEILKAEDAETVVKGSDVVVTTTPSRQPYLKAEWLHPGLHITAMGADAEGKQELHAEVLREADRLVCDQKSQCFRLGELHHGLEEGTISPDDEIIELGELVTGRKVGRQNDDEITVCDLVGIGVQDTAISLLTYRRALDRGLGLQIEV